MLKQCFIRALIAGVVFLLLQLLGDKYLFDNEQSFYIYIVQSVIFIAVLVPIYYFFLKKEVKKREK